MPGRGPVPIPQVRSGLSREELHPEQMAPSAPVWTQHLPPSSRGRAAQGLAPHPLTPHPRCWWTLQPSSGKASRGGSRAGGREVAPKPVSLSPPQRPRLLAPSSLPHTQRLQVRQAPIQVALGEVTSPKMARLHLSSARAGSSPLVFPGLPRTLARCPRFMSAQVQPIPLPKSRCGSWWPRTSAHPPGTQRWHLSTPGGLLLCRVLGGPGRGAKRSATCRRQA